MARGPTDRAARMRIPHRMGPIQGRTRIAEAKPESVTEVRAPVAAAVTLRTDGVAPATRPV
jgi:hypothetical protein